MDGIDGGIAIVTGGANGLGASIARGFVLAGASVIVADIATERGEALQAQLGRKCMFVKTDLRQDTDIENLLAIAASQFGKIDFLINIACSYAERGQQTDRRSWHEVFDVNLIGHAMLIQRAVELLKKSQAPSVVNFSSMSGHVAQRGRWVYPATKAAIEQFTRSAALDLAEHGIRVNCVLPGVIEKAADEYASAEAAQRQRSLASRTNMLSRLQTADEVGSAVLFLCSRHASFITGSCMAVDGGYSALGPQGKDLHVPQRPASPGLPTR